MNVIGDVPSQEVDGNSRFLQVLHLGTLLQKLSSSALVSECLQFMCQSNFGLVCFFTQCTAEQCKLLPALSDVSMHLILSPVVLALRDVLALDSNTDIRLRSEIMNSRAFFSGPGSRFSIVSQPLMRRFSRKAALRPPQCDIGRVIKTTRALIVATALKWPPILRDALLFELQQAVVLYGDSIQLELSLVHDVVSLFWIEFSASAAFVALSVDQVVLSFDPILKSMKELFQKCKNEMPLCTRIILSLQACTLFVVLLKLDGGHAEFSSAAKAHSVLKTPSFLTWFSYFLSKFTTEKFLEPVPLMVLHKNRTFMRCAAAAAFKRANESISKIITLQSWRGDICRNDTSKFALDGSVTFYDFSTLRGPAFHRSESRGYYEIQVKEAGKYPQYGFCTPQFPQDVSESNKGCGDDANSWAWDGMRNTFWHNGANSKNSLIKWTAGDCLGFEVDFITNNLLFSKNGKHIYQESFSTGTDTMFACISAETGEIAVNFGMNIPDTHFEYPPLWLLHGASVVSNRALAYPVHSGIRAKARQNVASETSICVNRLTQFELEQRVSIAVSLQQPLFADLITLDLLERRSVAELHHELNVPEKFECSIEESSRVQPVVSVTPSSMFVNCHVTACCRTVLFTKDLFTVRWPTAGIPITHRYQNTKTKAKHFFRCLTGFILLQMNLIVLRSLVTTAGKPIAWYWRMAHLLPPNASGNAG